IPLTWGVVGTVVAPQLAALGAVAALVGRATIVIERVVTPEEEVVKEVTDVKEE
ncbi:MAG: DUF4342 domain-containing protein, partial [Anaerolineae bacterium]|nr:DUF4342 domain-containing protein [Anaerolineae bacterium]